MNLDKNLGPVVIIVLAVTVGLLTFGVVNQNQKPDRGFTGDYVKDYSPQSYYKNPQVVNTTYDDTVEEAYQEIYRTMSDSIVSIKVFTDSGVARGTGFVYADNYIVTNNHVIKNARLIEVRFNDGHWSRATVRGADAYSDLAVLKAKDMPEHVDSLKIADNNPRPGTRVVALGNPYGLEGTITQGIVSGLNRTMNARGGFVIPDTIQTDAPINPGNSGGPLVNMNGVVVGVNRAKKGDNVGFAISPEIVNRVVPALIETGEYYHPYIGVGLEDVTPVVAQANGLNRTRGVIVTRTVTGGPAMGELRESTIRSIPDIGQIPVGGDIILAVDGRKVSSTEELISYLARNTSPGDDVNFTVLRDGRKTRVTITATRRPDPR